MTYIDEGRVGNLAVNLRRSHCFESRRDRLDGFLWEKNAKQMQQSQECESEKRGGRAGADMCALSSCFGAGAKLLFLLEEPPGKLWY